MRLSKALGGYFLYASSGQYSSNTIAMYRNHARHLALLLGDPDVSEITPADLEQFLAWLNSPSGHAGRPLAPATRRNAWCFLRSFFSWASTSIDLPNRPDQRLAMPKGAQEKIHPFTRDEVAALMKHATTLYQEASTRARAYTSPHRSAKRNEALIRVLLDSGCRIGEISRLDVRDVSLDTGEVWVAPYGTARKTHGRTVFLGQLARRSLWAYLASRPDLLPSDPLFSSV